MDASDHESYGECEFGVSVDDSCFYKSQTKVRLKKEPGPWIAHNPARLLEVRYLKLELPDNVSNISDSIGDLHNLERLIIKRGINLNCLPHTLSTLPKLESLHLENCPNLSQLPSNFGNLVTLRCLTIRSCTIKSLPQSLSLIELTLLELNNCVFIQELPPSLHVEFLKLVGCHVKSFSAKPRNLNLLEINKCLYVHDILTSLNHFDSLRTLQIKGCDMESLPNSITRIHNLKYLEIQDSMNLKRLPDNLSELANINKLTLVNCALETIPSGLRSLARLSIKNCPMEFHVIKELVSLTYVTIKSCSIKYLDGCITGLTKLKYLIIEDCVALEYLPTDINSLVSLRRLRIEGCTSIKFLPSLPALHNLYSLSLKSCSGLDELPADFDKLTNLRILKLTDTNVQSLPSAIAKLSSLKNIHLPGCFRLETLPNDLDLKVIKIYLQRSFRLDTLPAKFSVTTLRSAYQIHLRDHKESSLEIINDKECDVDVDNADESGGYLQAMVNTLPNLTHILQPRPGYFCRNVVGETSGYALENGQTGVMISGYEHGLEPSDHCDLQNVKSQKQKQRREITIEDIQQCFSTNMTLVNAAKGLGVSRSTMKRRLKELKIEWPSSRKGIQNHSSKKKNHNPKSLTFVSESLERISVDGSDPPDQAHASECSDVANQLMLPEFALTDAEKTWLETLSPMSPGDFGTNVIGETRSCITPTAEDRHNNAFSLVSQGRSHHLSQESGGTSSMMHNKADKRSNVNLATLKRYREPHACGMRSSRKTNKFNVELASVSKSTRLDSDAISSAVPQEHTQHLHASSIEILETETDLTQRLDPKTMVRVAGDTRNATHDQICQDNRECVETCSVEAQDGRRTGIIVVKAEYKEHLLRFDFLSTSSVAKLREEVLKRLPLQEDRMMIKYKDEDNDWVLLACYDDLQHCLRLSMSSESKTIRLMIVDS